MPIDLALLVFYSLQGTPEHKAAQIREVLNGNNQIILQVDDRPIEPYLISIPTYHPVRVEKTRPWQPWMVKYKRDWWDR